eukprot:16448193-Heterocapsa_arctica.AAC.1
MKDVVRWSKFRDDSGGVPSGEVELCTLLVQRVLPELSEEEVRSIVAERKVKKKQAFSSSVKETDKDVLGEVLPNEEALEVEKEVFAPKRKAAASSSKEHRAAPAAPSVPPLAPPPLFQEGGSSGSGGDGARAQPLRVLRPIVGEAWTSVAARQFLPTRQGVSISVHTNRSWQVKYFHRTTPGPKSHTRTWTDDLPHREALMQV